MIKYLSSAFSINMLLDEIFPISIHISEIDVDEAAAEGGIHNIIGHPDTAAVIGQELFGAPLAANRESVQASTGDTFIVGQYRGPRLPEGTTELPEGAEIKFYRVEVG